MGVDPGPFTARELLWMAQGRQRLIWGPASWLLCQQAELNRDKEVRSEPFTPAEFNPTLAAKDKPKEKPLEVSPKQFVMVLNRMLQSVRKEGDSGN